MIVEGLPSEFWVVVQPTSQSDLGDICFKCDFGRFALQVRGGLRVDEIVGIYKNGKTATAKAVSLLKG